MMLRLGLGASARAAFLSWIALACCAPGCGDGDVIGDGGLGTQGGTSVGTRCGDGTVSSGEQCDDGNVNSGDGCSSSCTREAPPVPGMNDAGTGAAMPGGSADASNTGPDAAGAAPDAAISSGADAEMDAAANGSGAEAGGGDASSEEDTSAPPAPEPLCPAEPPGPCEACNCTMCKTELDACTNLAGDAAEGPAQGTPKAALCEALVRCGRSTGCRSIACVCSADTQASCLMGETPPDGPCKDEVLSAAETTDMLTFLNRATMPAMGYAVAVASAVSTCAANACASACAAP